MYGTAKTIQWDFVNIGNKFDIWPILYVQNPGELIIIPPDTYHAVIGYDKFNMCQAINYIPPTPEAMNVINQDVKLYENHDDGACYCHNYLTKKNKPKHQKKGMHNDAVIIGLANTKDYSKHLNKIRDELVHDHKNKKIHYKCYKQYDQEISSNDVQINNMSDGDINMVNNSNNCNPNNSVDFDMINKSKSKQPDQSHQSSPSSKHLNQKANNHNLNQHFIQQQRQITMNNDDNCGQNIQNTECSQTVAVAQQNKGLNENQTMNNNANNNSIQQRSSPNQQSVLPTGMPPLMPDQMDQTTNSYSNTSFTNNNNNISSMLSNNNNRYNNDNHRFSQNNVVYDTWLNQPSNISNFNITNIANVDDTAVTKWLKSLRLNRESILIQNFQIKNYEDLKDVMNLQRPDLYQMFGEGEDYDYDDLLKLNCGIKKLKRNIKNNKCKNKLADKLDETKKIKQYSNINDCKKSIIKMDMKHGSNVPNDEYSFYYAGTGKYYKRNDIIPWNEDKSMDRNLHMTVHKKAITVKVIGKKITGKTKLTAKYLISCPMKQPMASCRTGVIQQSLATHLMCHPGAENEGFKIPSSYVSIIHLCYASFSRSVYIIYVYKYIEFECALCLNKKFNTKSNYTQHMQLKHRNFKNYQCEWCLKKYKYPSSLSTHYNECSIRKKASQTINLL